MSGTARDGRGHGWAEMGLLGPWAGFVGGGPR